MFATISGDEGMEAMLKKLLVTLAATLGLSLGVGVAPASATIKVPLPNVLPIIGGIIVNRPPPA